MKIGSLFSGYGGLDLAVMQLLPEAKVVWHCEWDDAPSRILEAHWPDGPIIVTGKQIGRAHV